VDLDCPFCDPPADRIWVGRELTLATPDMYPAAEGHTLVLPRRHVRSVFDLADDEWEDLWDLLYAVREELRETYRPDGFTVGINDGLAAGQTIDHAHVHVIPRHLGDVADPTGGLRGILPHKARYWER
jgi:diadenosine tetraphosphate (Ap4A) HIT family hydrolase